MQQPPAAQLVSFKICGMIIDAFGPVHDHAPIRPLTPLPVDSHFKRHFPSPEENADNRSYVNYINLHTQTIPYTQGKTSPLLR